MIDRNGKVVRAGSVQHIISRNVTADERRTQIPLREDPRGAVLSALEIGESLRFPYEQRESSIDLGPETVEYGGWADGEGSSSAGSNSPKKLSLKLQVDAQYASQDLTELIQTIERFNTRVVDLGRKPLITLSVGTQEVTGHFARLVITQRNGLWPNGSPRSVEIDVEVARAKQVSAERWQPSRQEPETRYVALSAGDTYETVSALVYGHPRLADLLRRINPELSMFGERVNDEVRAFEAEHTFMQQDIVPQAPPFATGFGDIIQAYCEALEDEGTVPLSRIEADLESRGLL